MHLTRGENLMADVLIIDDDLLLCKILSDEINKLGHSPTFVLNLRDGLQLAGSRAFDVIMLDVQLPDGNGIEQIPRLLNLSTSPDVIIMTAAGDPDGAEISIKCGAWDYIQKPASAKAMMLPLIRALEYRAEKNKKLSLITLDRKGIIGESPALRKCLELVAHAAATDANVLITGETGTGKELLSRAIHRNSSRKNQAFVIVDCSVIPENLVESLLFGHEKGAFTSAEKSKSGLIKQADKGTLFLDEVGELPLGVQKSFLRVLQERRFRPVGSKKEEKSDFRLIAATNRDLEDMARQGKYREDLLYRLNSFLITAPPLRERKEDISELAISFVTGACRNANITTKGFSSEFLEFLNTYDWPGNIRELFNVLNSSLAAAVNNDILYPYHLPVSIRARIVRKAVKPRDEGIKGTRRDQQMSPHPEGFNMVGGSSIDSYKAFKTQLIERGEKEYFFSLARIAEGNSQNACHLSGLSRSRLYHFLKKYSISLSDFA